MIIELRGKSVDLTPAMKEHFEAGMRSLEGYGNVISSSDRFHGEVHVYKTNDVKVHIHAQLKGSRRIEATETGHDFYLCVNKAVKGLERQVRKMNDKAKHHRSDSKGIKVEARTEEIIEEEI